MRSIAASEAEGLVLEQVRRLLASPELVARTITEVQRENGAAEDPMANTTLGLAKQILDRGCAAVVASPWPLDARVPYHWLPEFLRHWSQAHSLIQANFLANRVVDHRFSQDPARGLAMTIFGNPALRRT